MMYVIELDCDPIMWLWLDKHIWCYGLYVECLGFFETCFKVPKTAWQHTPHCQVEKCTTHGAWQKGWSR